MLVVPAIDLRAGKCVRLRQGSFTDETVYADDPASVARGFVESGSAWIHVVDLDGARLGEPQNFEAVRAILAVVGCARVQFGGGVRDLASARTALDLGVSRVVVGTQLVRDPLLAERMVEALGDRLVAGIDARQGSVAVEGWIEGTEIAATDLALRVAAMGARRLIFTDISRDGMLAGPNVEALSELVQKLPIPVVASGGVTCLQDIVALRSIGVEAAIVGKALYEGRIDLREAIAVAQSPLRN